MMKMNRRDEKNWDFFCGSLFLLLALSLCMNSCQEGGAQQVAKVATMTDKDTMASPSSEPQPPAVAIDSSISIDYIMGKFDPTKHKDFTKVEKQHASRTGMYLRKDTYAAFKAMQAEAKKAGVQLTIRSATRNFADQKRIWEGKWNGTRKLEGGMNAAKAIPDPKERALKILEWSSMPGSSRHHWGTDIDLNDFTNEYFAKGKGLKEYEWLQANAIKFGFCQPYSPKGDARPHGYNEEKWHWSFLPFAKRLSDQCQLRLKDEMIKGFDGSNTAQQIGIVKKYVLGINEACL